MYIATIKADAIRAKVRSKIAPDKAIYTDKPDAENYIGLFHVNDPKLAKTLAALKANTNEAYIKLTEVKATTLIEITTEDVITE